MELEKIEKSRKIRKKLIHVFAYTCLTFWAVMVLFPFYWMILTSLKSYSAYNSEYFPKFLHCHQPLKIMWMLLLQYPWHSIFLIPLFLPWQPQLLCCLLQFLQPLPLQD